MIALASAAPLGLAADAADCIGAFCKGWQVRLFPVFQCLRAPPWRCNCSRAALIVGTRGGSMAGLEDEPHRYCPRAASCGMTCWVCLSSGGRRPSIRRQTVRRDRLCPVSEARRMKSSPSFLHRAQPLGAACHNGCSLRRGMALVIYVFATVLMMSEGIRAHAGGKPARPTTWSCCARAPAPRSTAAWARGARPPSIESLPGIATRQPRAGRCSARSRWC